MWALLRWWRTLNNDRRGVSMPVLDRPQPLELSVLNERTAPTFLDPSAIVLSAQRVPSSSPPPTSSATAVICSSWWSPIPVLKHTATPTIRTAESRAVVLAPLHQPAAFTPVALQWLAGESTIPLKLNSPRTTSTTPEAHASSSWVVPGYASHDLNVEVPPPLAMVSATPPAFLPENVSWVTASEKPQPDREPNTNVLTLPSPTGGGSNVSLGSPVGPKVDVQAAAPQNPNVAVFYLSGSPGREVLVNVSQHGASGSVTTVDVVKVPQSGQLSVSAPSQAISMPTSAEIVTITVRDDHRLVGHTTQFLKPVATVGDVALFHAYRVGESTSAFQHLVKRYEGFVQRVGERVLHQRADAQDVGQQVFLELSRFQGEFSGTVAAWLRTVTKNTAISFLRASRRRFVREQSVASDEAEQAPLWESLELADAIEQLPAEVGEAVRLRYLEGYSQQEAAELVGCPRGTLSRRASDGVRALRGLL